ncbi:MAG: caspase family protein [Candidatus Brocadiia bacterium]
MVGIDRYATRAVPDLTCAANDAESVATALRRTQPSEDLELTVLMSPPRLENALSPTRDGILRALREAAEVAGEHDTVLFYFAGHGGMVEGRPCLLPADTRVERGDPEVFGASLLPVEDVQEAFQGHPCRRRVIMLDCCQNILAGTWTSEAEAAKSAPPELGQFGQRGGDSGVSLAQCRTLDNERFLVELRRALEPISPEEKPRHTDKRRHPAAHPLRSAVNAVRHVDLRPPDAAERPTAEPFIAISSAWDKPFVAVNRPCELPVRLLIRVPVARRNQGGDPMRRARTVFQAAVIGLAALTVLTAGGVTSAAEREKTPAPARTIAVPVVEGDWWQIAPDAPDIGEWSTGEENACDFTIYRDADGTWHCVSCIRGTSHYGRRLFYHWRSDELTKPDWEPVGIMEVPRGKRGRPPEFTSVQAPHAFRHDGRYYMFYNSGPAYCLISEDGKDWRPHKNVAGEDVFFPMGRDVCVFHDEANERWIAYYCGTAEVDGRRRGAMVARTAPTPEGPWSEKEIPVRTEGNPESPFMLKHDGHYYLWQQMSVYRSTDPLDFNNAELVAHMTEIWYGGKWAPEVIEHGGEFYIAGYGRGIHVARLKWEQKTPEEVAQWRRKWLSYMEEELRKKRERERRRREAAERENARE